MNNACQPGFVAAATPQVVLVTCAFIDEIGRMESLSPIFTKSVRRLLDSGKIVVATIALKGGGFIAEVKGRLDCEIREVTTANRESLVEELVRWISVRAGGGKWL